MSEFSDSMYRGCLVVVLVLLLLTFFCLANLEPGSASYYLCIFSLIVDVPFFGYLVYKMYSRYRKMKQAEQQAGKKENRDFPDEGLSNNQGGNSNENL